VTKKKITQAQLRQIIKEETKNLRKEGMFDWFGGGKEEEPTPEPEQDQEPAFEMPPLTSRGKQHIEGLIEGGKTEEEAYAYYQGLLHAMNYGGSKGDEDGRGWIGQHHREKLGWPGHTSDREGIGADYNPKHPIGKLAWIADDEYDEVPVRAEFAQAVDFWERTLKLDNEQEDNRKRISPQLYSKSRLHKRPEDPQETFRKTGQRAEGWGKQRYEGLSRKGGNKLTKGALKRIVKEEIKTLSEAEDALGAVNESKEWTSYEDNQKLFEGWRKFTSTTKK